MKDFVNDEFHFTQKLNFSLGREENILGNGENSDYQHFLLFPKTFQNLSQGCYKLGLCGTKLKDSNFLTVNILKKLCKSASV